MSKKYLFDPDNYIAYGFMLLHLTRTISDAKRPKLGLIRIGTLTCAALGLSSWIERSKKRKQILSSVEDKDGDDDDEDDDAGGEDGDDTGGD